MKKKPVRLAKKQERKPLLKIENNMIFGVPIEFILITLIMVCFFGLVLVFLGPCTESGKWFNRPLALILNVILN